MGGTYLDVLLVVLSQNGLLRPPHPGLEGLQLGPQPCYGVLEKGAGGRPFKSGDKSGSHHVPVEDRFGFFSLSLIYPTGQFRANYFSRCSDRPSPTPCYTTSDGSLSPWGLHEFFCLIFHCSCFHILSYSPESHPCSDYKVHSSSKLSTLPRRFRLLNLGHCLQMERSPLMWLPVSHLLVSLLPPASPSLLLKLHTLGSQTSFSSSGSLYFFPLFSRFWNKLLYSAQGTFPALLTHQSGPSLNLIPLRNCPLGSHIELNAFFHTSRRTQHLPTSLVTW